MHQGSGEKPLRPGNWNLGREIRETLTVKPIPPWATSECWRCPEQRKDIVAEWNWPEIESVFVASSRATEVEIYKPLELTS